RSVMGRKGLGKLSLFSIAESIEVHSIGRDGNAHGFRMTVEGIKQAVADGNGDYEPEVLCSSEVSVDKGTKIVLKNIRRERMSQGIQAIRKRLARRFSIIGPKNQFVVKIDGEAISPADRDDIKLAQFIWCIGDFDKSQNGSPKVLEEATLSGRNENWNIDWKVNGWLGTVQKPKQLESVESGNLNGVVVLARGRLIHENILEKLNDGRLFTKYLTGQIEADFLDTDGASDIATSDRQRVQENDERYIALIEFLKSALGKIDSQWSEWRIRHAMEDFKKTIPSLQLWIDDLPTSHRQSALTMLGKINAMKFDETDDKRDVIKSFIMAFERMKLRGTVDQFVENVADPQTLIRLFSDRDSYEAVLYRDIVHSRLQVIRALQVLIDENAKEKALQNLLFTNLWLLDPTWERVEEGQLVEKRLVEKGIFGDDHEFADEKCRVDIKYRTVLGKHLIVELKRADRVMDPLDLQRQGCKYVDVLKEVLMQTQPLVPNPDIEVVFVLGRTLDIQSSAPDRYKNIMAAISAGSRVVYYDTLIHGAQKAYQDYLDKIGDIDKLEKMLDEISL
ncbi:MAG TPA: hypothetical protein VK147_04675, partial [Candidatus Didemnitutus sp.]|nr:hypothetical protein [Candidatus Didemnitutus sp.]